MANKPGLKPKYKDGVELIRYNKLIPKKRKKECDQAIEKIVEKDKR